MHCHTIGHYLEEGKEMENKKFSVILRCGSYKNSILMGSPVMGFLWALISEVFRIPPLMLLNEVSNC